MKNRALEYWDIPPPQERAKSSLSVSEESPPSPPREAYHYPQVRDALEGNPKGIVSSSPGLRACELPWDIVQTASQPQRGCGRARHPRTQPHWGWSVSTRWTQGSSLLATLGFAAESLRDSHDSSPEMWVVMSREERDGARRPKAWRRRERRPFSHTHSPFLPDFQIRSLARQRSIAPSLRHSNSP